MIAGGIALIFVFRKILLSRKAALAEGESSALSEDKKESDNLVKDSATKEQTASTESVEEGNKPDINKEESHTHSMVTHTCTITQTECAKSDCLWIKED